MTVKEITLAVADP